jgi:hypothetical protein
MASRPHKRVMLELRREAGGLEQEEVTVENMPGDFSAEYRALLSDLLMRF